MSDRGYIYVLFNPLMTGLVKVGKTTRDPEERAAELSSSTGVPTPFIVAYQREVNDCTRAEDFVHSYLTNLGCRVNNNREFFRASLTTAIDAILEYCKLENSFEDTSPTNNDFNEIADAPEDEVDNDFPDKAARMAENFIDRFQNPDKYKPLHQIELDMGYNYCYGFNDYIQDYEEALTHYKLAIKYGSTVAYRLIGEMYVYGWGVKKNHSTALHYFKQGIEHGDYFCYANMIYVYFFDDNKKNADKCFFKAMKLGDKDNKTDVCYEYIKACLTWDIPIDEEKIEMMRPYKREIADQFEYTGDDEELKETFRQRKKYVREVLFNYTTDEKLCEAEEELGDNYYCGSNGYTEDYEEALKHYKIAIKYGSIKAYDAIGHIYFYGGSGVHENHSLALKYFKYGIEKGNHECYEGLLSVYEDDDAQNEDVNKYFLKAMESCDEDDKIEVCAEYISHCQIYEMYIERENVELMRPYKEKIMKRCKYDESLFRYAQSLFS